MGLFGKVKKGLVFVVSAPSGTGKTTLVDKLLGEYPEEISRSVSCTTRAPRRGEKPGVDYIFLSEEEFTSKVKAGFFLEYATVFGHRYGTLKETVTGMQSQGKHVVLVIDTQGALSLKGKIEAVFVFMVPPSIDVLRRRIQQRNTDSAQDINLRLSHAQEEMEKARAYDVTIVNDDLQKAYEEFKHFVGETEKKLCTYVH